MYCYNITIMMIIKLIILKLYYFKYNYCNVYDIRTISFFLKSDIKIKQFLYKIFFFILQTFHIYNFSKDNNIKFDSQGEI